MKVIFLQDIPRVGKKNDLKEVNDGYAMNFLIPSMLAQSATSKAISELDKRKKNIEIEGEVQTDLLQKNLEEIKGKVVIISGKANEKGSLFKAIHLSEIAAEMESQHHVNIAPEFIILEKPIKEIGEFEIPVEIKNKKSFFKIMVKRT
jgi:large subunit ribosomal protein L9